MKKRFIAAILLLSLCLACLVRLGAAAEGIKFRYLSNTNDASYGTVYALAIDERGRAWCFCYDWTDGWIMNGGDSPYVGKMICDEAEFVALTGGNNEAVGLDAQGNVWVWSLDEFKPEADRTPHIVLSSVKQVSAYSNQRLALANDGKMYYWGSFGSTCYPTDTKDGRNTTLKFETPTLYENKHNIDIQDIYVYSGGGVIRGSDGSAWSWNRNLLLGMPETVWRRSPDYIVWDVTAYMGRFRKTDMNQNQYYGITADGALYATGVWNACVGDDSLTTETKGVSYNPIRPDVKFSDVRLLARINAADPAKMATVALDADGNLWGWGQSQKFFGGLLPNATQLTQGMRFIQFGYFADWSEEEGAFLLALDGNGDLYIMGKDHGMEPELVTIEE